MKTSIFTYMVRVKAVGFLQVCIELCRFQIILIDKKILHVHSSAVHSQDFGILSKVN